jgi:uncharacterized repeat protein (TIGR04076 family)
MQLEPDKNVKIVVTYSECAQMREGYTFFLKGPMLEFDRSSSICVTALLAIYPWIFTARFGIKSKDLEWNEGYHVWCPEKMVEFTITNERCRDMGNSHQTGDR